MEKLKISLTFLSSAVFLSISIFNPEELVILSFLSWSIIVFASAIIVKMNGINPIVFFMTAGIDFSTAVIAFFMGAPLGLSLENGVMFTVGIICLSVILIFGRKFQIFSLIVNLVLTILSHIPVIIYYLGENKGDKLYILGASIVLVILLIQLFFSEKFISEMKDNWKEAIIRSSITLLWTFLSIIELPMVIF